MGVMTHDDYHHSHLMLIPEGAAWPKEGGALYGLSQAITKAYERVSASADQLEEELLPETSLYLLEDYEKAFGLPECDQLLEGTIESRRQAVFAKDTHQGGLSPWALQALCGAYGIDVEITTAHRHHCLRSCMYPLYSYDSQFYIIATIKSSSVHFMTVLDNILTPLLQTDALAVSCLLEKYVIGGWEVIYVFEEE